MAIRLIFVVLGVPFFFKQWGGVFKAKAGRELDGQSYDTYPEVAAKEMPDRLIRLKMLEESSSR